MIVPAKKDPGFIIASGSQDEKKKREGSYIQSFLQGTNILERLEDCITETVKLTLKSYNPTFVSSFPSWNVYSHSNLMIREALREYGFREDKFNNQDRLFSPDYFFAPIRLRFARGKLLPGDGHVIFNARKGCETRKGIKQNHQHFRHQRQLLSLSQTGTVSEAKVLNLWAIYDFTEEWLNAWLVEGTEEQSQSRMFCDDHLQICSKSLIEKPQASELPPAINIDVPFGERKTNAG